MFLLFWTDSSYLNVPGHLKGTWFFLLLCGSVNIGLLMWVVVPPFSVPWMTFPSTQTSVSEEGLSNLHTQLWTHLAFLWLLSAGFTHLKAPLWGSLIFGLLFFFNESFLYIIFTFYSLSSVICFLLGCDLFAKLYCD